MLRVLGEGQGNWTSNQPLTTKGQKYVLVDGMISKLNANKALVKNLLVEQKNLKKMGKNLSKSDQTLLSRGQEIVARLEKSIEKQIELFELSYEKVNGTYVYRSRSCVR